MSDKTKSMNAKTAVNTSAQIVKVAPSSNAVYHEVLLEVGTGAHAKAFTAVETGGVTHIKATPGSHYQVIKRNAKRADELLDQVIATQQGEDLVLSYADGTVVQIDGFYHASQVASSVTLPSEGGAVKEFSSQAAMSGESAVGQNAHFIYAHGDAQALTQIAHGNDALIHAMAAHTANFVEVASVAGASNMGWLAGIGALVGGGVAIAGGGGAAAGAATVIPTVVTTTLSGTIFLGKVLSTNGLEVLAFKADGTLLGTATVSPTGAYTLAYTATYTGAVYALATSGSPQVFGVDW